VTDLPVHRIAPGALAALAEGVGDGDAIRSLVAAQRSKHFLLVRQVVASARAAGHEQAPQAGRAYDLLASVQDEDAAAVDAVLGHPPAAAWASSTIRRLDQAGASAGAAPAQLAALAAAAAIRAGISWSGDVPLPGDTVMLPSLGQVTVPSGDPDWARITTGGGGAEVTARGQTVRVLAPLTADQPGWQGLRSLSATAGGRTLRMLVEDLDPYRAPDAANAGPRLSVAELDEWQSVLDGAWDSLVGHHSRVADQAVLVVKVFTPLSRPGQGQVSATSRLTFGSIALSAPPDACALAVTLAHEIQHAKLSALLDLVPMTLPDDGTRYYAPWRDDPRPASGLLQGAYAFLAVAAFWREQRRFEPAQKACLASAEFARWRTAVETVVRTLTLSGRLTAPGQLFVAGLARALAALAADQVPADAAALAERAAREHRDRWSRRHGAAVAPGETVTVAGAAGRG
jgi:HEXXH motif-containing protein